MKRAGLLLCLMATACGHPRPPVPQPPKYRTVAIVIPDGVTTGSAYVDDVGGGQRCELVAGYCDVTVHDAPTLQQTYVTVDAPGFTPYRQDAVRLPAGNVQVWTGTGCGMPSPSQCVNLPALTPLALPRLIVKDWYFVQENGVPFTVIGCSDFDLYRQFLMNGDVSIEPVLQQRASLGCNVLRVFGSFNGALGSFVPTTHGELWYAGLSRFARALAAHGLRGEFVVFADTSTWLPDPSAQVAHWNRTIDALRSETNILIEAVNEADQPINRTEGLPAFPMPSTLNSSHGSNGSGAWGVEPFWHWTAIHTNLEDEWWRKVGHNCYEIGWIVPAPNGWRGPCYANENRRPDQDAVLQHFFDAAAGAALLSAGSTFHSNEGKASQLFEGVTLDAAKAWIAGARSVPLYCQPQPYGRPDPPDPGDLRTYYRGSDPACRVHIHP
jgi:hypothetical protein